MKLIFIVFIFINSFSVFCQTEKVQNENLIYQTLIDDIRYKKEKHFIIQKETESYYLRTIIGADIFRDTLYMYEVENFSGKKLDTFRRKLPIDTSWGNDILNISGLDSNETNLPDIEKYKTINISRDSLNSIFDPDKKEDGIHFISFFPKQKVY